MLHPCRAIAATFNEFETTSIAGARAGGSAAAGIFESFFLNLGQRALGAVFGSVGGAGGEGASGILGLIATGALKITSFANEGFVRRPQIAMVGDAPGEGEFILRKSTVDAMLKSRGEVSVFNDVVIDAGEILRLAMRSGRAQGPIAFLTQFHEPRSSLERRRLRRFAQ